MWQALRHLAQLLSTRQRWQGAMLALMLLGNALLEMVGVGLVPVYVGILAEPDRVLLDPRVSTAFARVFGDARLPTTSEIFVGGTALLFAMFTVKLVYAPLLAYVRARYIQGVVQAHGARLFETYMRAPHEFHLRRHSAELIRNITVECTRLGETVLNPLVGMLSQMLITVAVIGVLVAGAPGAALASLLGLAVVTVPVVMVVNRQTRRLAAVAQEGRMRVIQCTQEGLGGVKEIQLLRRQGYFIRRFQAALRHVLDLQRYLQVANSGLPVFMEWVAVSALLLVVVLLYRPGTDAGQLLGVAALFAVALARLKGSVAGALAGFAQVRSSLVSVETVYRDLRGEAGGGRWSQRSPGPAPVRAALKDHIRLEDVWFRYSGGQQCVLRGVDLTIRRGEAVGFVGSSGAGKSTLVDVILGILEPERGAVRVDGTDVRRNLAGWQQNVGYIPQAIYLLDGSIRENVALGIEDNEVDAEAVARTLRAASLEEFVRELPGGLDARIGERGARLSGGQRQRIAIARALYHDPEVLVMDEATSALDNLTEKAVMEAVEALKGERTILMIAHRLSTVRSCDRIVFLKDGAIAAIGTYAELAAAHPDFRRLAEAS